MNQHDYGLADNLRSKLSFLKRLHRPSRRKAVAITAVVIVLAVGGALWYHAAHKPGAVKQPAFAASTIFMNQLPSLKKKVSEQPNDAQARKNYAVALYATGNPKAAKDQYEAAVKINPKDAVAYNNLGNVYRDLHDIDQAVTAYEQAITIDPKSINTYANLANIQLYTQNNPDAAIATYKQGLKQLPNNSQLQLLLGIAYEAKGDTAQAKQTYRDILQSDPSNTAAQTSLTRLSDSR